MVFDAVDGSAVYLELSKAERKAFSAAVLVAERMVALMAYSVVGLLALLKVVDLRA